MKISDKLLTQEMTDLLLNDLKRTVREDTKKKLETVLSNGGFGCCEVIADPTDPYTYILKLTYNPLTDLSS